MDHKAHSHNTTTFIQYGYKGSTEENLQDNKQIQLL